MPKNKNKNSQYSGASRIISGVLIPVILFVQIAIVPTANAQPIAPSEPKQVTSLVAVLVEDSILENNTAYPGISEDYPDDLVAATLRDRIYRYARDVQATTPYTQALILRVKKNDSPVSISQALETLYANGDSSIQTKSQLDGVVLIGDIPLPVVNKNGYRFVSMFPYTDFEEKTYIYNSMSNEFERNSDVLLPKVEAWHGVIKSPASGESANSQLAYYFDKNHLFHIDNPDFADFNRRMFFADIFWEQENMDKTALGRYAKYIEHMSDFAYMRFTKTLLKELSSTGDPAKGDGMDNDMDGLIDEDLEDGIDNDGDGLVDEDNKADNENPEAIDQSMFDNLPDVQSRNIILSYALKYNEVVKNFIQNMNDYIEGTGRYDEYDSVMGLIAAKDLYTQEYLKKINEALEKKVDDIVPKLAGTAGLIEESNLTGTITFDDDSTVAVTGWNFINYTKNDYTDPIAGVMEVTYYNGLAAPKVSDASQCSIYYGGNTTEYGTAQMIERNRVYIMETTKPGTVNSGYDGCWGTNILHPERCFTDLATKWVAEKLEGTSTVQGIPDSAASYGGCYDFREENRFSDYLDEVDDYNIALNAALTDEEKNAIPLPDDKHKPASEIVLYSSASPAIELTFKDILDIYGGFDGKDNDNDGQTDEADEYKLSYKIADNDWYTIGRELLGSRKTSFIINNPPFAGIKKITLNIAQTKGTKVNLPDAEHPFPWVSDIEIPSITYHKEPTLDTIKYHLLKGNIDSFPANNPRYVAFQDKGGSFQKFNYPDSFKTPSGENFKNYLKAYEERLKKLPGYSPAVVTIDGKLQEVLEAETENEYADALGHILLKTTLDQADEAIRWRNMSIDEKHAYVIRAYIDKNKNAYLAEQEKGYEYMYLTAEGSYNELKFEMNKDAQIGEQDETFINPESTLDEDAVLLEDDWEGEDDSQSVFILEWFKYIIQYLQEITKLPDNIEFKPVCGEIPLDEVPSGEVSGADALRDDTPLVFDANNDGIPDSAEATMSLGISFKDGLTKVPSDSRETYPVAITALDSSGQPSKTDSFTQVKLEIIQTEEDKSAKAYGADTIQLIEGTGVVNIVPTGIPGSFSLMAHTLNRPAKIISNSLNITSVGEKIRVLTYEMEVQDPPTFTREVLKDYIVKNSSGDVIAIINTNTGKIEIKNPDYEVEVFESTNFKPMRIAVTEIKSGTILASVVIVPKKDIKPVIEKSDFKFEENLLTLDGVHIKDVNGNDYIGAYAQDNDIYVLDNHGLYSKRIAKLTSHGKVYTADGYFINIKNPLEYDKPYIFEITDAKNSKIMEFFIGYPQGGIKIVKEDGDFEQFNIVSSLLKLIALNYAPSAYAQSTEAKIYDTDSDGLTDIEEITLETDRLKKDSDADGYTDGDEVKLGYDPLKKDLLLFIDLPSENEAYEAFTKLLLRGIVERTPDNKIRPDDKITREEYVQMVLGLSCTNCSLFSDATKADVDSGYSLSPFPDNDIQNEYLYCVKEGKNRNIIIGYESGADEGFFKPAYNISRAEAFKVVLEAAGTDTSKYDIPYKPWYYKYVLTAQDLNLVPRPVEEQWLLDAISRAEFALLVSTVMEGSDCYLDDSDNDGIPDNIEKYQYNTDPNKADTDEGGLNDLEEIIGGKNPLDPEDDMKADTDGDGMQDTWETENNLDPYDPEDANFDMDSDGLINLDEFLNDTDPRNPDTDGGGKDDGDEVILQDTDPNNPEDDGNGVELDTGISGIGDTIEADIVYEQVQQGETTEMPVYVDSFPADNESLLFLSAEILDENGDIMINDSTSIIEFFIRGDSETTVEIIQTKVKVTNGVATTQIKSSTKAGLVNLDARIIGKDIPSVKREIFAEPLEPYELKIIPESTVIKTGGLSKTPVKINVLDKNGNIVNNDFVSIDVSAEGPGRLDTKADAKPDKDGIQLESYEGVLNIDLYSTEDEGDILLNAFINNTDEEAKFIEADGTVKSTKDIKIVISADKENLIADGEDIIEFTVKAANFTGNAIQGFNQQVTFKTSNQNAGEFLEEPIKKLADGMTKISFKSSSVLNPLEITAAVFGMEAGSITIPMVSDVPVEVRLTSSKDKFDSSGQITLTARLYDKFGNPAVGVNGIPVEFRVTDATSVYGAITGNEIIPTENGLAAAKLKGKNLSGPVNITAVVEGLKAATLTVQAIKIIKGSDLVGDYPNVLYATMTGAAFGDTTAKDYTAGLLLFKGRTQAVTSLTTPAAPAKPLADISYSGGVKLLDEAQVRATFVPANNNNLPNRIIFENPDTQESLAEVYFVFPDDQEIILQESLFTESMKEGIYIKKLTTDELFGFINTSEGLAITYDGQNAVLITKKGELKVNDNFFTAALSAEESPFLSVKISRGSDEIADVVFAVKQTKNVSIKDPEFNIQSGSPIGPGIYIKPLSPLSNFTIEKSFSGISTHLPYGASLVNTDIEISGDQAPGFSYTSLERVYTEEGIGLAGDNKHSLFFAAGNTVGNSNKPYASEIGINLGDPTIRIKNENLAGSSGYTEDIGKPIYFGDEEIKELLLADYNNDSLTDILLAYEKGNVKLIEHRLSAEQFKDRGNILDLKNGILSADSADFNNDGFDDLLISTRESCVGDEVCIYIYENQNGNFVRSHIPLDVKDKISEVKIADLNNDDYPDIVLSDLSGNVRIYYNNAGIIETDSQILENLGIRMNSSQDLKDEVLIHYTGMPEEIPDDPEHPETYDDDFDFEIMQLKTGPASQNEFLSAEDRAAIIELGGKSSDMKTEEDVSFIYMDKDPIFGTNESKKQGVDINGSTLTEGDKVVYTITVYNTGANDINNLMLSDLASDTMELNPESIKCLNCEEGEKIGLLETGQSLRPYVITNIDIPKEESRIISYESTILTVPKIKIDINKNYDAPFTKDDYFDISLNPEGNTTGKIIFYYSVSKDPETGKMTYARYISDAESSAPAENPVDVNKDDNNDGVPDELADILNDQNTGDSDGDGIPDSWDDLAGKIDKALEQVGKVIDALSCGAGCLPMPINMAFLVPGQFNAMGIPLGFDPGLPIFGWGAPSPIPIWPPTPYQSTLGGRLYLSPTLTGSLATAVCLGPYPAGACWATPLPISLIPESVCDAITEALTSVMSKVTDFTSSLGSATTILSGGGSGSGASSGVSLTGRSQSGGMTGSSVLGSYSVSGTGKTNKKVPGFPKVITDWFAKQMEEVIGKLSDLPDLYVIYPDINAIVNKKPPEAKFKNFTDVLTYINKLPLIQLESKSILIKIPAITQKDILKLQTELKMWVEDAKMQVQKFTKTYNCKAGNVPAVLCTQYIPSLEKAIQAVENNIKTLEQYKDLPRKILEYRNIQTKYIKQIICYLDSILTLAGGYFKKQQARIKGWIDFVKQVKETLKTWKSISNIMKEYSQSCGTCKTERFTLSELMMKLFVVIPDIPVIPFPKWPDIYFDFSQIQVGLKIIWPDVRFKAEPLTFPSIPRITLPDFAIDLTKTDNIELNLPGIPTIPSIPELPALPDLPDLPGLPIPTLPDIPKPPRIPKLSASLQPILGILSKILKILCLLDKSMIPVLETNLKTQIEALTARPSKTVLPIDTMFSFQSPTISYPYLDKIKISVKMDLRIETEAIYKAVNELAKEWNSIVTDVAETTGQLVETANKAGQEAGAIPDKIVLKATQTYINVSGEDKTIDELKNSIKNLPYELNGSYANKLRTGLIAYAEKLESVNINDLSELENYPLMDSYIDTRITASLESPGTTYKNNGDDDGMSEVEEYGKSIQKELSGRLLAINTNAVSSNIVDAAEVSNPTTGQQIEGLFVYNKDEGINESILAYLGDIQLTHHAKIIDIDDDTDEDIFYSYGGNVYLKENYKKQKSSKYLKYITKDPAVYNLSEFVPLSPSVNGFGADYESGLEVDFSWDSAAQSGVSGYEIVYKDSLEGFDGIYETASHKINIFKKPEGFQTIGKIREDLEITVLGGSYLVNGESPSSYNFSDRIDTSDLSETKIVITFSDSSQIILGPSTSLTLPDYNPGNFGITLHGGQVVFKSNYFTNLFLQEGGSIVNENAECLLEYKNGDLLQIKPDTIFFGTTVDSGTAYISSINGEGTVTALPRKVLAKNDEASGINKDYLIHTMEDSSFALTYGESSAQIFTISANTKIPVSSGYAENLNLKVLSGKVEIIDIKNNEKEEIRAEQGMLLEFGDSMELDSGTAEIKFINGGKTSLIAGDTLLILDLESEENPAAFMESPEGNYYSQIYTYDSGGNRSNPSDTELFAPQLCSDKEVPFADAGPSERDVIILQTLEIDGSKSFDTTGSISSYYLDTNPEEDTNNDGDSMNDKDMINESPDNPVFVLGPFDEIKQTKVVLNVQDQSLNTGKQLITINVIVPEITLDESSSTSELITGYIDPSAENIPITLIRNRSGILKNLMTDTTDGDGEYLFEGLDYEDMILVRNSEGDIVAEINPLTGRVIITDPGYYADVLEAEPPALPTRVVVKEKITEIILITILMIPDMNTDVVIETDVTGFTNEIVAGYEGVHIIDREISDKFIIKPLPASDPNFTGAAEIINTDIGSRIAIIDSGGSVFLFDPKLDLQLKAAYSPDEPVIIEITYEGSVIAELYISINNGRPIEIINRDKLKLPPEGLLGADSDNDGMSDKYEYEFGFNAQDPNDANLDFDGDGLSNLEEFRLKTNPLNADTDGDGFSDGDEVSFGKDPLKAAESPFADVSEDNPYYQSIINLTQRNILRGDIRDGKLYFNPQSPIARKDFTDLILKMLCIIPRAEAYREPSLLSDIIYEKGKVDYYYAVIKEAILQGFITGYIGEKDPVSGLSPFKPDIPTSKAEAIKIVLEALEQQKIITLKGIEPAEGDTWYLPYMEIAKDLTPYLLKETYVKETYVLTSEEAANPEDVITRAEFAAIADRVIKAFDCYVIDDDMDGMPSVWELQYGLNPYDASDADDDPDGDGLINRDEFKYGTDPFNKDTDGGGATDKEEVDKGTNPVNYPADDKLPSLEMYKTAEDIRKTLEEGVYIVEDTCNSCPCKAAIDHKADLIPGDIIYTIIAKPDISKIFAKSNEVIFKGLLNQ